MPPDDRSRRLFALDSRPRARPPSTPPAATGSACLDLTPLTDFCNQHGGRAHWADDCSSPELPFLTIRCLRAEASEAVSSVFCEARRLRTDTEGTGHAGEVTRVSVHAAAQRPTPTSSDTSLSSTPPPRRLEPPRRLSQPRSFSGPPRERTWLSKGPEVPSTVRKPPGVLPPSDRHLFAARRRPPKMNAPFSRSRAANLDGPTPLDPRRLSPVGR